MSAHGGSGIVVGVDVATAEIRVTCADGEGRVLARSHTGLTAPVRPAPGCSEQDARAWWPAAVRALHEALGALDGLRSDVVALSVSSTSGTIVLADANGEPVGPALMYDDRRAGAEAEIADDAGRLRWRALGVRIAASFALPKLAWLMRHAPERRRVVRACSTADMLVWRLTSEPPPADWSHALKTGYDVIQGEWPGEVLARLDIDPSLLPPVAAPATLGGRVGRAAAEQTGLPEGCEVRLGMTDGCAAQLAAGAGRPGRAVSVLGTTMVLKAASHALLHDPTGAVYSHRHPNGWWLPGGASNTGAQALRALFPGADLHALDIAARQHGPASYITYPLLAAGERFPFSEPAARGFSLGVPRDRIDHYRAILEGVAFIERMCVDHLADLGLEPVNDLCAAGGASRSLTWNTIRATVLERPVVVTREATTAFGTCMLAAAGPLHTSVDAAMDAMVHIKQRVEPAPVECEALRSSRQRLAAELRQRGWLA